MGDAAYRQPPTRHKPTEWTRKSTPRYSLSSMRSDSSGPRLTPVEIVAKMGVFDARDKPLRVRLDGDRRQRHRHHLGRISSASAPVDAGSTSSRWTPQHRASGGARTANQVQRAKDRLALLKRTLDAGQGFRAVVQTNRVADRRTRDQQERQGVDPGARRRRMARRLLGARPAAGGAGPRPARLAAHRGRGAGRRRRVAVFRLRPRRPCGGARPLRRSSSRPPRSTT